MLRDDEVFRSDIQPANVAGPRLALQTIAIGTIPIRATCVNDVIESYGARPTSKMAGPVDMELPELSSSR